MIVFVVVKGIIAIVKIDKYHQIFFHRHSNNFNNKYIQCGYW